MWVFQQLRRREMQLSALGVLVVVALYFAATATSGATQAIVTGVAASFAFATMLLILRTVDDNLASRQRRTFFGSELVRHQTRFVYPDFIMHNEIKATLAQHNQQLIYQRPASRYTSSHTHRIDLERAVAGNDVRAVLYLADIFDSTPDCPNIIEVDSVIIEGCDCSFISVGLSSNDCTHLYLDEVEAPLFSIVEDGNGSEYLRLCDGTEFRSTKERQYGLILRHAPNPEDHPERRWFLVAGLGPNGTTGAAWYLANHWTALARQIPPTANFAAVISCSPATDRTAHLVKIVSQPHQPAVTGDVAVGAPQ